MHLRQAIRKKRAAQLILTTESIREISWQLGFVNTTSFCRWFINTFGCSVYRWRESSAAGSQRVR